MFERLTKLVALSAAVTVGVVACEPGPTTGPGDDAAAADGTATLKILLTDAPADYVASAWVDIGRVDLVPADESEGIITLTEDGTDGMVDLLTLQGDATAQLADTTIEPGAYRQLRLIVDSARVDLIEGYAFRDGSTSRSLKVPSGAQTGIKLNLFPAGGEGGADEAAGIQIIPGETVLVLDFDVNQSFVIQGNPETPAGIKSMLFTPTIRVSVEDAAGSIAGAVTGPDTLAVDGLVVTAEPTGAGIVEGYQTQTATALTDGDGEYTIHFVVPGEYEVSVETPEGYFSDPALRTVFVDSAQDVMDIDFALDETGSIAGAVSATDDSIAVDGLTVTAALDGSDLALTAETDADGNYAIAGAVPGDWTVTVEVAAGFFTTPESASVTVAAGEDVTGVDFEIDDAAGSIAGQVTGAADSIAVDGLTVTAADTAADVTVTADTDADGNYSMGYVLPGDYLVTVAVPEGFVTTPDTAGVAVGTAEDVAEVDFTVDEPTEGGG